MRRPFIGVLVAMLALCVTVAAQAKNVPPTQVPTTPSIDGAVFTTVNSNDPNYAAECKNGNPAVNCNQYTGKQFVFLNGGPTMNHLSPDGVYFFAVVAPSGQSNPADGTSTNLSDDYDCYLNREVIIQSGEVTGVLHSTDPSCFHNTTVEPVGTSHALVGPKGPFVQLWPYADTPNPGGAYMMQVCYVGSPAGTPTAPISLADPANVDPKTCKNDAFKVQPLVDTTPPTCKLAAKMSGPPAQIEVVVQDQGSGLEKVVYSGTNLADQSVNPPGVQYPNPLVVGSSAPFYIIATKGDQKQGATLSLTITDVAGNNITCDPAFGVPLRLRSATVRAGHRATVHGLRDDQGRLWLGNPSGSVRSATVFVNGRPYAVVSLGGRKGVHLNLASALRAHGKNTVSVRAAGPAGRLLVRISN